MNFGSVPREPEALIDRLEELGYGDGLPVVAPTQERVEAMCAAADLDPGDVLGRLAPLSVDVTADVVAANAVMAGCPPAAFPVVLAAFAALTEDELGLGSVQATTHPVAVMCVVNGPVRHALRMNTGAGALGPGNRASATIGRALRLLLMNAGGARPGQLDRATHGSPAKFSFCFAEHEEFSPWEPFAARRGVAPGSSAVTVMAADGPYNVQDHGSDTPEGVARSLVSALSMSGTNALLSDDGEACVILSPEHARLLAQRWPGAKELAAHLAGEALIAPEQFSPDHVERFLGRQVPALRDGRPVPVVRDPANLHLVVAGGAGRHSLVAQGFGYSTAVTLPVQMKA